MKRGLIAGALAGTGAALYGLRRQWYARLLDLPPPTHRVRLRSGLRVPVADGVMLATDHFAPESREPLPTVLVRTPYGRASLPGQWLSRFTAERFAERGYHVIYQDTRGRFDSEGAWEPYVHEAADGAATMDWIARQEWSDGQIALWGASYVGFTQWAAATAATTPPAALVPVITQSFLADRGGAYHLHTTLLWLLLLDSMVRPDLSRLERFRLLTSTEAQNRSLLPALEHLPIATADEVLLGRPEPFFRRWGDHPDLDDPYWRAVDLRDQVAAVRAPVHLITGWYDLFTAGQLADYERLHAAGRDPYLTVGPWIHIALEVQRTSIREGLAWFDSHLKGRADRLRSAPVRIYVMGADEWRDLESWPPPSTEGTFFLRAGGGLAANPGEGAPTRYHYDPADPTPNLGGPLLSSDAGPVDNRPLEARSDVVTFTGAPRTTPLEIIGTPRALLFVHSSRAHTDFFARLCDVHPDGRSINLCDALVRIEPGAVPTGPGESLRVEIPLTPTAHRFLPGHRLRLQISSGAFPRYSRNPGSDEPLLDATGLHVAQQSIYHDETHPSRLLLPVTRGAPHETSVP